MCGLEELLVLTDERDKGDRCSTNERGKLGQVVVGLLCRRVEDRKLVQYGKASDLPGQIRHILVVHNCIDNTWHTYRSFPRSTT